MYVRHYGIPKVKKKKSAFLLIAKDKQKAN